MEDNEFERFMKKSPHVVILGAGASVATIPNGDINGKRISVMKGFIDNLEMRELFKNVRLSSTSDNLEDIYSELNERNDCKEILKILEQKIYNYFSQLELPNEVTIYDMLLLSLREKDIVATFNWDPLLLQAYQRVNRITSRLPKLIFLHGNVLVGLCEEHKQVGILGRLCPVCNQAFKPTKLLYPIKKKEYESNKFIRYNWNAITYYVERAYIFTIFGYSAPKTDEEAISLLKKAWGEVKDRSLEEIEIIDIRPEEELYDSWNQFIHTHHYKVFNCFFDSVIAKFPRRSCDATFDRLMNIKFLDDSNGLKKDMTFIELENYFKKLLIEEQNYDGAFSFD
jgi:hypothetical protein